MCVSWRITGADISYCSRKQLLRLRLAESQQEIIRAFANQVSNLELEQIIRSKIIEYFLQ